MENLRTATSCLQNVPILQIKTSVPAQSAVFGFSKPRHPHWFSGLPLAAIKKFKRNGCGPLKLN
jgi:hypothetical protein